MVDDGGVDGFGDQQVKLLVPVHVITLTYVCVSVMSTVQMHHEATRAAAL